MHRLPQPRFRVTGAPDIPALGQVSALFDSKANVIGSIAAFAVSLVLRLGGGEPLFGMPALIPYPEWWPFKTIGAGAGMILLPVVSRLTQNLSAEAWQ
jgi:hypothetical protein